MRRFPALKANRLLRILTSEPLNYRIMRSHGSHKILVSLGRDRIVFAHHGQQEISGNKVKHYLVDLAKLNEEQAWNLIH